MNTKQIDYDRLGQIPDTHDIEVDRLHLCIQVDHTKHFPILLHQFFPHHIDGCISIGDCLVRIQASLTGYK